MNTKNKQTLENAYQNIINESINTLSPILKEVAEAYDFEIKYDEELERWVIMDKEKQQDYGFYWDSSYDKENFFDELKKFFIDQGSNNRW